MWEKIKCDCPSPELFFPTPYKMVMPKTSYSGSSSRFFNKTWKIWVSNKQKEGKAADSGVSMKKKKKISGLYLETIPIQFVYNPGKKIYAKICIDFIDESENIVGFNELILLELKEEKI